MNCSTKAQESYLLTVQVLYSFALTYVKDRKNVRIYNYELPWLCPGMFQALAMPLPDHGFGIKGKGCHGGMKNKQHITVAFFFSAAGTKEKPVVV